LGFGFWGADEREEGAHTKSEREKLESRGEGKIRDRRKDGVISRLGMGCVLNSSGASDEVPSVECGVGILNVVSKRQPRPLRRSGAVGLSMRADVPVKDVAIDLFIVFYL
jgi:hypothetical protein